MTIYNSPKLQRRRFLKILGVSAPERSLSVSLNVWLIDACNSPPRLNRPLTSPMPKSARRAI